MNFQQSLDSESQSESIPTKIEFLGADDRARFGGQACVNAKHMRKLNKLWPKGASGFAEVRLLEVDRNHLQLRSTRLALHLRSSNESLRHPKFSCTLVFVMMMSKLCGVGSW